MNGVYGSTRPRGAHLGAAVSAVVGGSAREVTSSSSTQHVWTIGDGGKAVGSARRGGIACALYGFLHLPLSGWTGGPPMDDPDRAADYLLARYEQLGSGFLDDVWGRFVVAISDARDESLHLGTDPYGSTDLFVAERSDGVMFASSLWCLGAALGDELEVDRSLEDFFLVYGLYPKQRTTYRGVRGIPPATLLSITASGVESRATRADDPWHGALDPQDEKLSEDEVVDLVHAGFMRSLEEQLTASTDVSVLLGGFDSALVAAALVEMGKNVETFSFRYGDERYDQPHTDTLSRHLGTKHHWLTITPDAIGAGLRDYANVFSSPTSWPNYVIQTQQLAEMIRAEGFDYCYSGDGCDTLFYGYPLTYHRSQVLNAVTLPAPVGKALVATLGRPTIERAVGRPYRVMLGVLRSWQRDYPTRGYLTFRVFDEVSLRQLRTDEPPEQEVDPDVLLAEVSAPFEGTDPVRLAYLGKQAISPNRIKMNGSTSSTGVLITAPYLHRGMQLLAAKIPNSLLRPDGKQGSEIGKYVLTRMAESRKMLPHDIVHQRKLGAADAPLGEWYAGPLRDQVLELVADLPFHADARYVRSLIEPKRTEAMYAKLISRDTSNVVTLSHAISLLATYGAFTGAPIRAAHHG